MKMKICRKKQDSFWTFKYLKKRENGMDMSENSEQYLWIYIKENEVDNFNSRDYNNNHWKITLLYKGGNRNGTDF